jgi:hypothetical protein
MLIYNFSPIYIHIYNILLFLLFSLLVYAEKCKDVEVHAFESVFVSCFQVFLLSFRLGAVAVSGFS